MKVTNHDIRFLIKNVIFSCFCRRKQSYWTILFVFSSKCHCEFQFKDRDRLVTLLHLSWAGGHEWAHTKSLFEELENTEALWKTLTKVPNKRDRVNCNPKFRQGPGLGGLSSRGAPGFIFYVIPLIETDAHVNQDKRLLSDFLHSMLINP